MNLTRRFNGSINLSSQIPRSPTVPQPRRSTFVDSTTTRPAPPAANFPAFIRCQSVGNPFTAEYWCIGGTTMRLRSSTPRMLSGENSSVPSRASRDFLVWRRTSSSRPRAGGLLSNRRRYRGCAATAKPESRKIDVLSQLAAFESHARSIATAERRRSRSFAGTELCRFASRNDIKSRRGFAISRRDAPELCTNSFTPKQGRGECRVNGARQENHLTARRVNQIDPVQQFTPSAQRGLS